MGTAREDDDVEAAVLREVLFLHPVQVTVEELVLDLADPADFGARDAIERAVRDLARAGLLHRHGEFTLPTRAAVRFEELIGR